MHTAFTRPTGQVGIIGHRSWIARELACEFPKGAVQTYPKAFVSHRSDYSEFDCLYVFAGRSRPDEMEMLEELDLIRRLKLVPRSGWPRRLLYVSSRAAADCSTDYGACKRRCELELTETFGDVLRVVRPGAVFGTSQSIDSPMLVPSLAREGTGLAIRLAHVLAVYIPVREVVRHLASFADLEWDGRPNESDPEVMGDPWYIPGSFTATADQLRALWITWENYRLKEP